MASNFTVAGTLTALGNTVLGSTAMQTLQVNAGTSFNATLVTNAAVTANSDVTVAPAGTLTARGNVVLGSLGNNRALTVSSATTVFNPTEAGASVTVAGSSTFTANNNVSIGTNSGNNLTVNSNSTFNGAVTGVVGIQVRAQQVLPSAAGAVIPNYYTFVDATGNTAATNILRMPIPIMGLHIQIAAGSIRFLLQSYGAGYLLNGDSAGATSHTIFPSQLVDCIAASNTTFYCSVSGPVWNCPLGVCVNAPGYSSGQTFAN